VIDPDESLNGEEGPPVGEQKSPVPLLKVVTESPETKRSKKVAKAVAAALKRQARRRDAAPTRPPPHLLPPPPLPRLVGEGASPAASKSAEAGAEAGGEERSSLPVLRPIDKHSLVTLEAEEINLPPVIKGIKLQKQFFPAVGRLLVWLAALSRFMFGVLWDIVRRRDTIERRAQRLLAVFQRVGGTVIKIGQQLAMRIDVLPQAYCRELTKLLETVKPFPIEVAVETIERTLGKRLDEVFSAFDPKPVGSASIACVYQAVLKTGEKVAVKVRRPGIDKMFGSDLRALMWLISLAETLTFVRPGVLRNFAYEFESTFEEELDFRKEARFQEIFARNASKKKQTPRRFFTAPRVYFEFSNAEVMVEEFVSGVWLWQLLAAVERNDEVALARIRELNIDPKIVSKRLMWINHWSTLGSLVFHCDPHPANIVIQPNNKIVFVDFGACGSGNSRQIEIMLEFFAAEARKDAKAMARAAVMILEPLAHVDVQALQKDIEVIYLNGLYQSTSKNSPWYARTTAVLWFGLPDVSRKYQLPLHVDAVRVMRATLLYDTIAFRLHPKLKTKDKLRYAKDRIRANGKRMRKAVMKRVGNGDLLYEDYAALEDMLQTGARIFNKVKALLDVPTPNFTYAVEKSVFAVLILVKFAATAVGLTATAMGVVALRHFLRQESIDLHAIAWTVCKNGWFIAVMAFLALLNLRRLLFRLNDQET